MMDSGCGMVAVVTSLRDAGLAVTLLDKGRQYTLCPRSVSTTPIKTYRNRSCNTTRERHENPTRDNPKEEVNTFDEYHNREEQSSDIVKTEMAGISSVYNGRRDKDGDIPKRERMFFNEYHAGFSNLKGRRKQCQKTCYVNPGMVNTKIQASAPTSDRQVGTSRRDLNSLQNEAVTVLPAVIETIAQVKASQTDRDISNTRIESSRPYQSHINLEPSKTRLESSTPCKFHTISCETFTVSSKALAKNFANSINPIALSSTQNKSTQSISNRISVKTSISFITLSSMELETTGIKSPNFVDQTLTRNEFIKDIFTNSINQSTSVVCDHIFNIFDDKLVEKPKRLTGDKDNENSINNLMKYNNFTFSNNYTTVYRAEISNDTANKYEVVITDWINDLPLKRYDFISMKAEKEKLFNKLEKSINNSELNRNKLRSDIVKILDEIPLEIDGSNNRIFKHKLSNVLVDNIQKINTYNNGESSNSKNVFHPTEEEMREFVTTELSDFIDKYQSEININSIIETEDELVDIFMNFTESIRRDDVDLVSEEIVALLRDSAGLFEHQAKYLTSVMLEHLTEIFRLVEESVKSSSNSEKQNCHTYMMINSTDKNNKNITDNLNEIHTYDIENESDVDLIIEKLSRVIEEWIDSLPVKIMQNKDDSFTQVAINDLATDIIDQQMYLAMSPNSKSDEADFENFKFQIFKWMNRISEDSSIALEHAGELMKRIKKITDSIFKQKTYNDKSSNIFGKNCMLSGDIKVLPMIGNDSSCCQPKPPECCLPKPPKCCREKGTMSSSTAGPSPYAGLGLLSQMPGVVLGPSAMSEQYGQYGPGPSGIQGQFMPDYSGMQTWYDPGPTGMQVQYGLGPSAMQDQYGPGPSGMQGQQQIIYGNPQFDQSDSIQIGRHEPRVFDPEPLGLPPGKTIQDVNDEYDDFLKGWVQQIPIIAKTQEEQQMADMMRKGIYNGVWKTIAKLKGDVELLKNRFYYEDVFEGEIEELLSMLPQTQELVAEKPRLKAELTDRTSKLNEMIRNTVAPDAFKENLIDKVNSYIPRASFDLKGENAVKLAEDLEIMKIVDEFILGTRYQNEDPVKANVHRRRLLAETQKLVQKLKENHKKELAEIPTEVYANDILLALQQVPIPDQSILTEEAESVQMQMEVEEWAKDLPVQPHDNPKEQMKRRRQIDKLAHRLHEMEKSINLSDSNANVRHEISDFLDRLPMERGATLNMDFMVDGLMNRVNTRVKRRDQQAGKYVYTPEGGYGGFSGNQPFASSFNESGMQPGTFGDDMTWQTIDDSRAGLMMQPGQAMPGPYMDGQPMPIQGRQGMSQSMGGQPIMGRPMMQSRQPMSRSMGGQPIEGPFMIPAGQMGGQVMMPSGLGMSQSLGGQPMMGPGVRMVMSGQPSMPSSGQLSQSIYMGGQPGTTDESIAWQTMADSRVGPGQGVPNQFMGGQPIGGRQMGGQPMGIQRQVRSQSMGPQQIGGQPMMMSGQPRSLSLGGQPMGGQLIYGRPMTLSSGRPFSSQLVGATADSVAWQTMPDSRVGAQIGGSMQQPSQPGVQLMRPGQGMSQSVGGQPMAGRQLLGPRMGPQQWAGQQMVQPGQARSQSMGGQPTGGPLIMPSGQERYLVQQPGSYKSFSFNRPVSSSFNQTLGSMPGVGVRVAPSGSRSPAQGQPGTWKSSPGAQQSPGRLTLIRESPMEGAGQQFGQTSAGQSGQTGRVQDTFHTAMDQSSSQNQNMPCDGMKKCVNGCCCPCYSGPGGVVMKCAQRKTKEQCTCISFDNTGRSQFYKSTDRDGISHFTNQNRRPSRCITESCKERARVKMCNRNHSEDESDHGKKCRCSERLKKYRNQKFMCMDVECSDPQYHQSSLLET